MTTAAPLLDVRDLRVEFGGRARPLRAVDGVSFRLSAGESVAIVGESGSGKSMTALALMGLLPASARLAGQLRFQGDDLMDMLPEKRQALRGKEISMVFQDPGSSLNPVMSVVRQVAEVFRTLLGLDRAEATRRSLDLLRSVGIPDAGGRARYPHQYSGGMRQRAMIAMAVACHPRVLIADEPTTGLDVTVQAQVLHLVAGLVRDSGTTLLLISHDLGVVAGMADRVLVMYRGRIVESAGADDLFTSPWHPYTIGLLASVPRLDRPRPHRMHTIAGRPPEASESIVGCSFAPRCPAATARCRVDDPALEPVGPGREVACWNWRSADRPADVS